ncbi:MULTISPECIES: ABC transporter permease subunit [unclassified Gemella]|uniref:ABC transporter permease subunit n=1 Tax=unclassified Gemella TaxID=2624949 RepID=UPI001073C323|nr:MULTISPECIES: ABC transporter permease subunit [unclassified Gemella]MBF0709814.1 ABC transporter permease subunit [Gemella sp. GL1.1]MBF0747098.1 ABC transporter permease subunit [Gemella sp. 19428wG2_WT2a]NYS27158.1 ABC transporter permease subunit [Gemella sp. GL1]TFU58341.1 ABC transporter permease [Gemella sp. WT2a]
MGLFINEYIKDHKKISTKIYLLLIIAFMVITNIAETWGRDKSVNLSAEETSSLLINAMSGVLSLSLIFTLIMLANNISQEYSKGTIKFLYSKPKSRSAILTSKVFIAIFNFVTFSIIGLVVDLLLKKFVFYGKAMNLNGILSTRLGEENYSRLLSDHLTIDFVMMFLTTMFYISLVMLICIVFKNQVLSVIVVMVMVLGAQAINQLLSLIQPKFEYIKYIFTNIASLSSYFNTITAKSYIQETFKLNANELLIMTLVYTTIFMAISYWINARRDINLD